MNKKDKRIIADFIQSYAGTIIEGFVDDEDFKKQYNDIVKAHKRLCKELNITYSLELRTEDQTMNIYFPIYEKHNITMMVGGNGSTKFYYCKKCDEEKDLIIPCITNNDAILQGDMCACGHERFNHCNVTNVCLAKIRVGYNNDFCKCKQFKKVEE